MTSLSEDMAYLAKYACAFSIEVNEQRICHMTPSEHLADEEFDRDAVKCSGSTPEECDAADLIATVHVYPRTPVSFFRVGHHDLETAVRLAAEQLRSESSRFGDKGAS